MCPKNFIFEKENKNYSEALRSYQNKTVRYQKKNEIKSDINE